MSKASIIQHERSGQPQEVHPDREEVQPDTAAGVGSALEVESAEAPARSANVVHTCSIGCAPGDTLPSDFCDAVLDLQDALGMRVLLLAHGIEQHPLPSISAGLAWRIWEAKPELKRGEPLAVLIDSFGGDAQSAYQIASILRRQCGSFVAVVPRFAKSAATLLSLGADKIILAEDAELGPLDAQVEDAEREEPMSALDEVQALERLHAFSLQAIDSTVFLLIRRSGKKLDTLMPMVFDYVSAFMRPLMEKIDSVHYTRMSRLLKVGEEYATRLLRHMYASEDATKIARQLVNAYPDHGFVIDRTEAKALGLQIEVPSEEVEGILSRIVPHLLQVTAIGLLREVEND